MRTASRRPGFGAGWPSIGGHPARAQRVVEGQSRAMETRGHHVTGHHAAVGRAQLVLPPESFEHPALSIDEAAVLMADLGFVAFRTPPGSAVPDSCLMAMIRDAPTRRHFDPKTVSYWLIENGHGLTDIVDRDARKPISRAFSWGQIRVEDRFGARNSFVTFGGWLFGERVGRDALLLIFRSPAAILRIQGHSQRRDRLSDEALAFFSRLIPRMWTGPQERIVGSLAPDALYSAFLVHESRRVHDSTGLRGAFADDAAALAHELDRMVRYRPDAVRAGREMLDVLGLHLVSAP